MTQQPIVPADCDLRDFAFMPLDVVRLRDSDIATLSSGDEFRSAVLLWCASWHQVPAASLPDDDAVLSKLAGYGFAVKEWKRVRTGALRGWVKCSDGRLYHPVVAEKALTAYDEKNRYSHAKLCDRLRKSGVTKDGIPDYETWLSSGKLQDFHWKQEKTPPEKPLKGEGEGKGEALKPPPVSSARESSDQFAMYVGWKPSDHFAELARLAGLVFTPGSDSHLGEFVSYWITRDRTRTQHEWDHAYLTNLKATDARKSGKKASAHGPSRVRTGRQDRVDNYAAQAAAAREDDDEQGSGTERCIDGEAQRIA